MTCLRCVIYWPRDLGPLSLGSQLYGPGRRCPPVHPHFLVLDEKVSLVSFPCEQRLYLSDPQLKPVHGAATWGERAHARRPSDAFARACRAPPTTVEPAPIRLFMPRQSHDRKCRRWNAGGLAPSLSWWVPHYPTLSRSPAPISGRADDDAGWTLAASAWGHGEGRGPRLTLRHPGALCGPELTGRASSSARFSSSAFLKLLHVAFPSV